MNGGVPPGEGRSASGTASKSPVTLGTPVPHPPRRPSAIAVGQDSQLGPSATTSSFPDRQPSLEKGPSATPRGPPRRKLTRDEAIALRRQEGKEPAAQRSTEKDCFIIPQGNLERFLPDGITV